MASNTRHIARGLEAVIDSANVVTSRDVWVNTEDLPEALRQIRKLSSDSLYRPEVYARDHETSVCILLD